MPVYTVPSLSAQQIELLLERVEPQALVRVRQALVETPAGQDKFVDGLRQELERLGLVPAQVADQKLRQLVGVYLAEAQAGARKPEVRAALEKIDLIKVAKRTGTVAATLLRELAAGQGAGAKTTSTLTLARRQAAIVAEVIDALGDGATREAVVERVALRLPGFDANRLFRLQESCPELVPKLRAFKQEAAAAEARREAELVGQLCGDELSVSALVQQMRAQGFAEFTEHRYELLRQQFPELVPKLERDASEGEELFADALSLARAARQLPGASLAKVAARAGFSAYYARRLRDEFDIPVGLKKDHVLRSTPEVEAIVLKGMLDLPAFASQTDLAERLTANPVVAAYLGEIKPKTLAAYLDRHLGDRVDFETLQRQKLTRRLVAGVLTAPRGASLAEVLAELEQTEGPRPTFGRLTDSLQHHWAKHPELYPEVAHLCDADGAIVWNGRGRQLPAVLAGPSAGEVAVRERLAALGSELGPTARRVVGAMELDDPEASARALEGLPEVFAEQRKAPRRWRSVLHRMTRLLVRDPELTPKAIAKALNVEDDRWLREDLEQLLAKTRPAAELSRTDVAAIVRIVRQAPPGIEFEALRELCERDPYFAERAELKLHDKKLRQLLREEFPEARDWRELQRIRVSEVLAEALAETDEPPARVFKRLRERWPTFPSFAAFQQFWVPELEANPELYPALAPLFGSLGQLQLGAKPVPRELVTAAHARRVAAALSAMPRGWPLGAACEEATKADPGLRLDARLAQLLGKRFPEALPAELVERDVAAMRALAAALVWRHRRSGGPAGRLDTAALAAGEKVPQSVVTALVGRFPAFFPVAKRRFPVTEHVAHVIGAIIKTMPLGTTPAEEPALIEAAGLLPPEMAVSAKTLKTARQKFPELVPTLSAHNDELFSRLLAARLFSAPLGTPIEEIYAGLRDEFAQFPISLKRFCDEVLPGWNAWLRDPERGVPAWLRALGAYGPITATGQGRPASEFPARETEKLQRTLAQIAKIPQRLPLLDKLIDAYPNAFREFNIVNVQHLLGSNWRFIEAEHRMGAAKEDIFTVGIPYSTSPVVARTMRDEGYHLVTPPLHLATWERQLEDVLYRAALRSEENGKDIVVFDDGGLVAKILHTRPWAEKVRERFRIVEQTTRGITVASKYDLQVPLINFARDVVKELEGTMIGQVVFDRLVTRLERQGKNLAGQTVTVVGYGVIGAGVARMLAEMGATVRVFDLDPAKLKKVTADAKRLGLDLVAVPEAKAAFANATLVVGNTGHTSIGAEAFDAVADGCLFASTSSKLVEIDMLELDDRATADNGRLRRVEVDDLHPPSARYELAGGKRVTVLADGFPINFDGEVNCVEPEDIQLTHGGMLISGIQATWPLAKHLKGGLARGLIPLADRLRDELVRYWDEVKREQGLKAEFERRARELGLGGGR